MNNKKITTIPFVYAGIAGIITNSDRSFVVYGEVGFERSAAKGDLKETIDNAIKDFDEEIAWVNACNDLGISTYPFQLNNVCFYNYEGCLS